MDTVSVIVCSHIDPVWLWNLSSGRRSWSNTITTALAMLRENPDMIYTCSSAALYRWIEETNPAQFEEIRTLVKEGRWEITGGWEVQSDALVASAEALRRQGLSARAYFREKFGVDVRTGYCVDSFGHSADLPDILRETGFEHYVFMRGHQLPELFRWKSPSGKSVLACQIRNNYGQSFAITREDFMKSVEMAFEREGGARLFFFGIGDHGGTPSRRLLGYLREAMRTYPLKFSSPERFFAEHAGDELPEFTGDIGPVFRGCYSANHRVKQLAAETEHLLVGAEALGGVGAREELAGEWRKLLFAHFHDSLPGTCVREAYERDIHPLLHGAASEARHVIDRELARREVAVETSPAREGGIFVVNPGSRPGTALVSYPDFTDPDCVGRPFNALRSGTGELLPLQILPGATSYGPFGLPWGKLTAAIPAAADSETVWALVRSDAEFPPLDVAALTELLSRLELQIYEDDTGTWGFTLERYTGRFEAAGRCSAEITAAGPVCVRLKACFRWRSSTLTLTLTAWRGMPDIRIDVESDWREHNYALKLAWTAPEREGDMTLIRRRQLTEATAPAGFRDGVALESTELPFVNWCALRRGDRVNGFYSPDLHGCDSVGNMLRVTLLRCLPYADHKPFVPNRENGYSDEGRTVFCFWFCDGAPDRVEASRGIYHCEVSPHAPWKERLNR